MRRSLADQLTDELYRRGWVAGCHQGRVRHYLRTELGKRGHSWFITACGVVAGFGFVLWVGLLLIEAVRLVVWGSL